MIMAVASPQVELLISLFFSEDDVNFSYVSYISTSGITTLHTQDIFLEKIKNHANNLIGDHIILYRSKWLDGRAVGALCFHSLLQLSLVR